VRAEWCQVCWCGQKLKGNAASPCRPLSRPPSPLSSHLAALYWDELLLLVVVLLLLCCRCRLLRQLLLLLLLLLAAGAAVAGRRVARRLQG
jgi:hypothetical protein